MAVTSGSKGLNFSGSFDVQEILDNQMKVVKGFNDMKVAAEKSIGGNTGLTTKPLTEYQAELIRIKQETLDLAKEKQALARADKEASLITQEALRKERELIKARNEEIKKRTVDTGDSEAEVAAWRASQSAGEGRVAKSGREEYIKLLNEDLQQGKIAIADYKAEMERLSSVQQKVTKSTKDLTLSQKELDKIAAQEKYNIEQNSRAMKNSVREMNAAKGSIEQRRAALIRLNSAYDNLNKSERESASGQRLKGIVSSLTNQVKDLEASTGRAQRNVGNYGNAFTNGAKGIYSSLQSVANLIPGIGVATILAFTVEPLVKYISSLDLFKKKLDETAVTRKVLNDVNLKGAQNAQQEVTQLKILYTTAKNTALSQQQRYDAAKKLQDIYPKTFSNYTNEQIQLGKTDKAYLSLASAIIATARARASEQQIAENSSRILNDEQQMIDLQAKRAEAIDRQSAAQARFNKALEDAKGNAIALQNVYANETVTKEQRTVEKIDKQINALAKDREILNKRNLALTKNITKEQQKGADVTGDLGKKAKDSSDSALKAQRALQKRIDELTRQGVQKQEDANEQEIASVKAKYAAMRKEAERFNKEQSKNGLRVNASGLGRAERIEVNSVIDKQEAEKLKVNIDAQKKIYDEFEQYKSRIGAEAARERFSDELDEAVSYLDMLQKKRNQISEGGLDISVDTRKQLELLDKEIAQEIDMKKKRDREVYANAVQAAMSYYDRIKEINRVYEEQRTALGEKATKAQLEQLNRNREEALKSVNSENAYRLSGLAELYENMDAMTRQKALDELRKAEEVYKDQYSRGLIQAKEYYEKLDEIEAARVQINRTENNPFAKVSDAIKKYRDALKGADADSVSTEKAQSEMWSAISEGAKEASAIINEIAGGLEALGVGGSGLKDALGSISGVLEGASGIAEGLASGNPVSIVAGSVKLLTSAVDLFNTKDKKLQKQIEGYKKNLESLGAAYKQLERDASNAVGNSIYATQESQINNLKQQQDALIRARDAEARKKKSDQKVIEEYNKQISEIPNQIEDVNKAISEGLIQTNFREFSNNLADAFTTAFKTGEDSAKAFDDVFNNVIGNAIKNSLKLGILDPVVKNFTDDLSKYARENNNSIIGFDFDSYKEQLRQAGELFTAGLKGSEEFFKDAGIDGSSNTLKGSIRADLTEETGTILAGVFRGVQLSVINIEGLVRGMSANSAVNASIASDTLNGIVAIQNNTLRTANNTDQLQRLEAVESQLGVIAKNTGDTIGLQLRAAGKYNF